MRTLSKLRKAALATALMVAFGAGNTQQERGSNADMGGAPRVGIDRPKQTFMLHERDKRVHGLKPFQDLVDQAPAGSILKPPPGIYAGPVVIDKPLIIEGGDQVTIDAGDKGTVMILNASNAVLRGLHLTGSGDSHDTDDSCLDVRGHNNVIENIKADNCLFGFDLKQSNNNQIRSNEIRSKDRELGVRGDGLRLWYSNDNIVEKNRIIDSRDMVAWYSHRNNFRDNLSRRSRYSIHFMFANDNIVERNQFHDNAVGVYFMYTEGGLVRDNVISHATGATGMGIGFKEASGTVIENNEIIYCGVGIGSDLSPFQPDSTIEMRGNRLAYNGIGVLFNSETGGNNMVGNLFEGNLTQVAYGSRGANNNNGRNFWEGNYWDDYQGFDRDSDGFGDQKHELYSYSDQIWVEQPVARFFRSSPVMELLDFLERLAPFSAPDLTLRDDKPRFIKPQRAALS